MPANTGPPFVPTTPRAQTGGAHRYHKPYGLKGDGRNERLVRPGRVVNHPGVVHKSLVHPCQPSAPRMRGLFLRRWALLLRWAVGHAPGRRRARRGANIRGAGQRVRNLHCFNPGHAQARRQSPAGRLLPALPCSTADFLRACACWTRCSDGGVWPRWCRARGSPGSASQVPMSATAAPTPPPQATKGSAIGHHLQRLPAPCPEGDPRVLSLQEASG